MTMTADMIRQAAGQYQALGLVAIPIRRGKPLVVWEPYQSRPPAPDELEAWPWGEADGLAIVCGHQHPTTGRYWWVLDIERQYRTKAEAWLDEEHPGWRQGLVAESQRGGLHVYCLSREPVRTGVLPGETPREPVAWPTPRRPGPTSRMPLGTTGG
jgi:hypothetical protein